MVEGLEVIIRYRGAKYNQVASPATSSSEFAILKRDLAHLRVHSPSQKNVRRVHGSFILHWPTAGMNPKVEGLTDSLHMRWFKLCSDDPEALKLREFLSIESILMTQDGVLIRSTVGAILASQDAPPGSLAKRVGDPLSEIAQQPALVSVPTYSSPLKPQPPPPHPPKLPPSAPRLDRQPPHLKRRINVIEGLPSSTRQKLNAQDMQTTTAPAVPSPTMDGLSRLRDLRIPTPPPFPLGDEPRQKLDAEDMETMITPTVPSPTMDELSRLRGLRIPTPPPPPPPPPFPPREPSEMTPHTPLPIPTPVSGRSPLGSGSGLRPCPASPHPSSSSSGNGDLHTSRRRDRDVNRLTRELWDTRRQLTAMQAREQVILDDLERLGARPESAGADRNDVSQDELLRLQAELRAERTRRMRAERALGDVERECRTPFVVPALFQAFMSISELSN